VEQVAAVEGEAVSGPLRLERAEIVAVAVDDVAIVIAVAVVVVVVIVVVAAIVVLVAIVVAVAAAGGVSAIALVVGVEIGEAVAA